MLQRVPPEGGYTVIADDVEDGWRRAMVLMSLGDPGRAGRPRFVAAPAPLPPLSRRGVRVFRTHPVEARCRCSSERIGGSCRSFPRKTSRK